MLPMSDERAIENAIVSTQMEGFEVTESVSKQYSGKFIPFYPEVIYYE